MGRRKGICRIGDTDLSAQGGGKGDIEIVNERRKGEKREQKKILYTYCNYVQYYIQTNIKTDCE